MSTFLGRAGGRLVAGLLIAGALGVGGFFFRDVMSGNVTELRAGDCFDIPNGVDTLQDVQHHPCNEKHSAEIMSVTTYPSGSGYPGDLALENYGEAVCGSAFATYTGRDIATEQVLTFGYMLPTDDGWGRGDHDVTCYTIRIDHAPMSSSVKVAAT